MKDERLPGGAKWSVVNKRGENDALNSVFVQVLAGQRKYLYA
jgi:hypothetical protein